MKIQWKKLLICIAIPLAVGGLSALLTQDSMEAFGALNQPPLSPPGWLFPVVWTILYVLMGIASYLVVTAPHTPATAPALSAYATQLFFNFCWSLFFFNGQQYLFAFIWLVVLWGLILVTLYRFYRIAPTAGYLLIPYLVWVTFAGYLNLGIAILNK